MRILLLTIILLFSSVSMVLADVTAEILDYKIDERGNIMVMTQYKIDGKEVQSPYPKLNGKSYFVTRYDAVNLAEKTDAGVKAFIQDDIEKFAEALIRRTFIKKDNQIIHDTKLTSLIGTTISKESSVIKLDQNEDGIYELEYTVKTDGTKTKKLINEPVNP